MLTTYENNEQFIIQEMLKNNKKPPKTKKKMISDYKKKVHDIIQSKTLKQMVKFQTM